MTYAHRSDSAEGTIYLVSKHYDMRVTKHGFMEESNCFVFPSTPESVRGGGGGGGVCVCMCVSMRV